MKCLSHYWSRASILRALFHALIFFAIQIGLAELLELLREMNFHRNNWSFLMQEKRETSDRMILNKNVRYGDVMTSVRKTLNEVLP